MFCNKGNWLVSLDASFGIAKYEPDTLLPFVRLSDIMLVGTASVMADKLFVALALEFVARPTAAETGPEKLVHAVVEVKMLGLDNRDKSLVAFVFVSTLREILGDSVVSGLEVRFLLVEISGRVPIEDVDIRAT